LLAEDNIVNQHLISRILEKMGHTVLVANDGAAALTVFSQQQFDLVAMDMQMPVMDGVEATKENSLERTSHSPSPANHCDYCQRFRRRPAEML